MVTQTKLVYMLEDDSDDRFITESTIAELEIPVDIKFFSNSTSFLEFLFDAPEAALILIDYNSKPDNGLEILKQLKHTKHSSTPIVILSDNHLAKYKNDCYTNGASSFIQKPLKSERTTYVINNFFNYWLEVAQV